MTNDSHSPSRNVYWLIGLGLFLTEVLIALFVKDAIIRPYGGDFLAVIMLYFFGRAVVKWSPLIVAIVALGIAFLIEIAQYLNMLAWLGLEDNTLARVVLGSSFEWGDMLAYTLGAIAAYLLDQWLITKSASN